MAFQTLVYNPKYYCTRQNQSCNELKCLKWNKLWNIYQCIVNCDNKWIGTPVGPYEYFVTLCGQHSADSFLLFYIWCSMGKIIGTLEFVSAYIIFVNEITGDLIKSNWVTNVNSIAIVGERNVIIAMTQIGGDKHYRLLWVKHIKVRWKLKLPKWYNYVQCLE